MDRFKLLGAPDKVNIPCLMHDNHLCHQLDVKITDN